MKQSDLYKKLMSHQDLKYRDMQMRIIPAAAPEAIKGVRTPELRTLAKELLKSGDYQEFLNQLPYPEMVAGLRSGEYYVNMMIAWYFATALAKQYESILPFIEKKRLDAWTHNKTIQKSIESFRISDEHKMYLRSLKV